MRIAKEFSLQYQKVVLEEDNVQHHEEEEVFEKLNRLGLEEVEKMAKLTMESPYHEKNAGGRKAGKIKPAPTGG